MPTTAYHVSVGTWYRFAETGSRFYAIGGIPDLTAAINAPDARIIIDELFMQNMHATTDVRVGLWNGSWSDGAGSVGPVHSITAISIHATAPTITLATPHGRTGTFSVDILGSNSTPAVDTFVNQIWTPHTATVTGASTFTIPANTTGSGTAGWINIGMLDGDKMPGEWLLPALDARRPPWHHIPAAPYVLPLDHSIVLSVSSTAGIIAGHLHGTERIIRVAQYGG